MILLWAGPQALSSVITTRAHPARRMERRDPGCYGKGHPDFALMDCSDSVAEEELSWTPWQQATDRQREVDA